MPTSLKILANKPHHKKVSLVSASPSSLVKRTEEVKTSSVNDLVRSKKPLNNIPGGKAQGKSPSDFNPNDLKKGIKIEMEHTPSKRRATEISMDHLTEFKNYYRKLPSFEKSLEKKAHTLTELFIEKNSMVNPIMTARNTWRALTLRPQAKPFSAGEIEAHKLINMPIPGRTPSAADERSYKAIQGLRAAMSKTGYYVPVRPRFSSLNMQPKGGRMLDKLKQRSVDIKSGKIKPILPIKKTKEK